MQSKDMPCRLAGTRSKIQHTLRWDASRAIGDCLLELVVTRNGVAHRLEIPARGEVELTQWTDPHANGRALGSLSNGRGC
jgi:hypothetical protein